MITAAIRPFGCRLAITGVGPIRWPIGGSVSPVVDWPVGWVVGNAIGTAVIGRVADGPIRGLVRIGVVSGIPWFGCGDR